MESRNGTQRFTLKSKNSRNRMFSNTAYTKDISTKAAATQVFDIDLLIDEWKNLILSKYWDEFLNCIPDYNVIKPTSPLSLLSVITEPIPTMNLIEGLPLYEKIGIRIAIKQRAVDLYKDSQINKHLINIIDEHNSIIHNKTKTICQFNSNILFGLHDASSRFTTLVEIDSKKIPISLDFNDNQFYSFDSFTDRNCNTKNSSSTVTAMYYPIKTYKIKFTAALSGYVVLYFNHPLIFPKKFCFDKNNRKQTPYLAVSIKRIIQDLKNHRLLHHLIYLGQIEMSDDDVIKINVDTSLSVPDSILKCENISREELNLLMQDIMNVTKSHYIDLNLNTFVQSPCELILEKLIISGKYIHENGIQLFLSSNISQLFTYANANRSNHLFIDNTEIRENLFTTQLMQCWAKKNEPALYRYQWIFLIDSKKTSIPIENYSNILDIIINECLVNAVEKTLSVNVNYSKEMILQALAQGLECYFNNKSNNNMRLLLILESSNAHSINHFLNILNADQGISQTNIDVILSADNKLEKTALNTNSKKILSMFSQLYLLNYSHDSIFAAAKLSIADKKIGAEFSQYISNDRFLKKICLVPALFEHIHHPMSNNIAFYINSAIIQYALHYMRYVQYVSVFSFYAMCEDAILKHCKNEILFLEYFSLLTVINRIDSLDEGRIKYILALIKTINPKNTEAINIENQLKFGLIEKSINVKYFHFNNSVMRDYFLARLLANFIYNEESSDEDKMKAYNFTGVLSYFSENDNNQFSHAITCKEFIAKHLLNNVLYSDIIFFINEIFIKEKHHKYNVTIDSDINNGLSDIISDKLIVSLQERNLKMELSIQNLESSNINCRIACRKIQTYLDDYFLKAGLNMYFIVKLNFDHNQKSIIIDSQSKQYHDALKVTLTDFINSKNTFNTNSFETEKTRAYKQLNNHTTMFSKSIPHDNEQSRLVDSEKEPICLIPCSIF